jgi:hypothetical protein
MTSVGITIAAMTIIALLAGVSTYARRQVNRASVDSAGNYVSGNADRSLHIVENAGDDA